MPAAAEIFVAAAACVLLLVEATVGERGRNCAFLLAIEDVTLARFHVRHVVPHPGCPLCMRARRPADPLPRWSQPRSGRVS